MKTIIIKHFKEKSHNRVSFVKVPAHQQTDIGLKKAKEMMEEMLDGKPIEIRVEEDKSSRFLSELNRLNLEFEVKK